jgi:hypothetical protein
VPKVHNKPIKRPRKGFKQESKRQPRRHPGLAHRTDRCATGQCPVHQGTRGPTLHLREFSEELRYNSPDCPVHHRTMSGALRESNSELASFGNPLRYNSPDCPVHTGLSGVPVEQRLLRRQQSPAEAFNARQSAQKSGTRKMAHRTVYSTCPVHHRTARQPHQSELQRSNPNDRVTWLAHRTLSGGAPNCLVRPSTAASTNGQVWWLGL